MKLRILPKPVTLIYIDQSRPDENVEGKFCYEVESGSRQRRNIANYPCSIKPEKLELEYIHARLHEL